MKKKLIICLAAAFFFTGCGTVKETTIEVNTERTNQTAVSNTAELSETEAEESEKVTEPVTEPEDIGSETEAPAEAAVNENTEDNAEQNDVAADGQIIITLYPDKAPITCENFQSLVEQKFYDGLTFHRVIDGFMAQGGDPNGDGTGGSDKNIKGEFTDNGVKNDLSHTRGIVSMARSSNPNSASSQFFICYADCSFLDGQYAAFGEVTKGMEVVDSFLKITRTGREKATPVTPIVIKEAVMIDPDDSGNPRVQITMDENSAE